MGLGARWVDCVPGLGLVGFTLGEKFHLVGLWGPILSPWLVDWEGYPIWGNELEDVTPTPHPSPLSIGGYPFPPGDLGTQEPHHGGCPYSLQLGPEKGVISMGWVFPSLSEGLSFGHLAWGSGLTFSDLGR